MDFVSKVVPLDLDGLTQVAASIQVEPAALWSLVSVETGGFGFLPSRRPKILFEHAYFSRLTRGVYDASHPGISGPNDRTKDKYGPPGDHQYDRLTEAMGLDETAALQSASWGVGQVMGENAESLGYENVRDLVDRMCGSEAEQLLAVTRFLSHKKLADALIRKDWTAVAIGYNGPAYAEYDYDNKLSNFYQAVSQSGLPDFRTRTTQMLLTFLSPTIDSPARYNPHGVDGVWGKHSQDALNAFQADFGLPTTATVDDETYARLQDEVAKL